MYDPTKFSQSSGSKFATLLSQRSLGERAFNVGNLDLRSNRSGRSGLGGAFSNRTPDEYERNEMEMMVM
jgi:hypothetical protein